MLYFGNVTRSICDQYHYRSISNYTQLARIKSSHLIHVRPRRQKWGRTRLFARAHRLVRLHGTRCYTAARCQPHLCPHRRRALQGTPRSPGYSTSHTCPSPHPLALMQVLVEPPKPQPPPDGAPYCTGCTLEGQSMYRLFFIQSQA